jgi:hypothetical protein
VGYFDLWWEVRGGASSNANSFVSSAVGWGLFLISGPTFLNSYLVAETEGNGLFSNMRGRRWRDREGGMAFGECDKYWEVGKNSFSLTFK